MKQTPSRSGASSNRKVAVVGAAVENPNPVLRFAPVFIAILAALVYLRALWFDFLWFDDAMIIRDRFFVLRDLANIRVAFASDAFLGTSGSFYRPLQTVTFMIDAIFKGPDPFFFHLTNVVLHVAGSLAIYWLLRVMRTTRLQAMLFTMLYAVHPVFVSTVAWVPSRGDQLLTIFSVLSVILFVLSLRDARPFLPYAHGVAFLLAFFSKETAAVVPLVCLLWYRTERPGTLPAHFFTRYFVLWIGVAAVWYTMRSQLPSADMAASVFGIKPFLLNLQIIPETLGKFFLPVRLSLIPQFNGFDTAQGFVVVLLLILLILRSGVGFTKRIQFGLAWYLLFTLPVMLFRNNEAAYFFDYLYHRSYVANIGLLLVLIELAVRAFPSGKRERLWTLLASATIVVCASASFLELRYFTDPVSFYTEAMRRSPRSALCHNNLAGYLGSEKKDHVAALAGFSKALEIYPGYGTAISNRGITYQRMGKLRSALADFEQAVQLNPRDPDAIYRRGSLRYVMNDFAGALRDYETVLATDKLYPGIWSAKASCLAMLGRTDEAFRDAAKALQVDARDASALNSRGLAKRVLGDGAGAIRDFTEAIEMDSAYSRPYNNRGAIYFAAGDYQRAYGDFATAVRLDSLYADAYSNRGSTLNRMGKLTEALDDLNTAIRINPDFADALQNRGVVQNVLRRFPEALMDFNRAIALDSMRAEPWLGRGITRYMLQDRGGCCADWSRALKLGSAEAASLLAQFCK